MPITVTNLTETRTFDADSVSIDTLADVIGTLIEDVQGGTFLGSDWTVTNGTTQRSLDVLSTSIDILADLVATFIADNPTTAQVVNFTFSNIALALSFDADSVSIDELAKVFARFASQYMGPFVVSRQSVYVTGMKQAGAYVAGGKRQRSFVAGAKELAGKV